MWKIGKLNSFRQGNQFGGSVMNNGFWEFFYLNNFSDWGIDWFSASFLLV